jgi:hypothetical protein
MNFSRNGNTDEITKFVEYMGTEIPYQPEPSYGQQAEDDAKDLIRDYFMDEIIEQLIDGGEASDDMYNDYARGDSTFHETITDKWYSPSEAIEVIDDLSEHEEEDSGLWEGEDYIGILSAKAAYTYGNAVHSEWHDLIEKINDEIDMDEVRKMAIRSALKQFSKSSMTIDVRKMIQEDGLDAWLMEEHEDMYRNNLTNVLKAEIEAIL